MADSPCNKEVEGRAQLRRVEWGVRKVGACEEAMNSLNCMTMRNEIAIGRDDHCQVSAQWYYPQERA